MSKPNSPSVYVQSSNGHPLDFFSNGRYIIGDKERYISDLVQDDWRFKWVPSTPVFLSSQTGTGKNHFVNKVLIQNIMKYNRRNPDTPAKILVLSNRIALNRQNKRELIETINDNSSRYDVDYMEKSKLLTPMGLDKMEHFGNVDLCSYQRLLNSSFLQEKYAFVIIDECHFFISDACFNSRTNRILCAIIENFRQAVRVYMSATMDDVFVPIMEAELQNKKQTEWIQVNPYLCIPCFQVSSELEQKGDLEKKVSWVRNLPFGFTENLLHTAVDRYNEPHIVTGKIEIFTYMDCDFVLYDLLPDYSYISHIIPVGGQPVTKEGIDAKLLASIKKNRDKWIIFVGTIKEGEALTKLLNEQFGKATAAFICAESKYGGRGSQIIYDEIAQNNTFSCRILVTTSVIDNGISIKDRAVKYVAIYLFDRVAFLQMLGRLRVINSGDTISLCLPEYGVDQIKSQLKDTIKNLLYRTYMAKADRTEQLRIYSILCRQSGRDGLDVLADGCPCYNPMAIVHLANRAAFLEHFFARAGICYNCEFTGELRRLYHIVLGELEDEPRKNYMQEVIYDILRNRKGDLRVAIIDINLAFLAVTEFEKGLKDRLEKIGPIYYKACRDVSFVRIQSLYRYKHFAALFRESNRQVQQLLIEAGCPDENMFLELADEKAKIEYLLLKKEQQDLFKKVEYFRRCFNFSYQAEEKYSLRAEQLSWLGKLEELPENTGNADTVFSKEEVITFLQQKCIDGVELDKLDSCHFDEKLIEHGFCGGMGNSKLLGVACYLEAVSEKKVRQISAVNKALEKEDIPYKFQVKNIRSEKGAQTKGKVWWICVKK